MKLSYRMIVLLLLAGCSNAVRPTAIPAANIAVPSALPLTLLTPAPTMTFDSPSLPIRIENIRLSMSVGVDTADGALDQLSLPAIQAGYWPQSAPLGTNGNTLIIGFAVPNVFEPLRKLVSGDTLLITDQHGLTRTYRVTDAAPIPDLPSAVNSPANLTLISMTMTTPLVYFVVHAVSVP